MPIIADMRQSMTEAIGEALRESENVRNIVITATGIDPFNVWTSDKLPRVKQLSEILDVLEVDGTERWLLTYVLFETVTNENLRKLIVKACPETLVSLPLVDNQVASVLEMLQTRLNMPLPAELKQRLRSNRDAIKIVSVNIIRLFAYKSWHECLHQLQLWLTFGSISEADANEYSPLDPELCLEQINKASKQGWVAAQLLDSGPDEKKLERDWIAKLEVLTGRIQTTIDAGESAISTSLRDEVLRFTRQQLAWLNKHVLKSANELTLANLIEFEDAGDALIQLQFAIRDLKPTVLARALKHKMWQDAENEFWLLADLWPAGSIAEFNDQWISVKSTILWLAQLDPNEESARRVRKCSADVDDSLAAIVHNKGTKPSLESYRKLTKFWFFAIDAALKSDCSSLRKIDESLRSVLQEIDHDPE